MLDTYIDRSRLAAQWYLLRSVPGSLPGLPHLQETIRTWCRVLWFQNAQLDRLCEDMYRLPKARHSWLLYWFFQYRYLDRRHQYRQQFFSRRLWIACNERFYFIWDVIHSWQFASYRSSCCRPPWIAMDGKLHSTSNLLSSSALRTLLTKMTTWLNSKESSKSLSFRFFWFSSNLT